MNAVCAGKSVLIGLVGSVLAMAETSVPALAQATGALTGTIVDATTGRPLPAVRVSLPGTAIAGLTDSSGTYQLFDVRAGNVHVRIQLIGFATILESCPVGGGQVTVADFEMTPIVSMLDEVLVIGGAVGRRREVASSLQEVDRVEIESSGATTVSEFLSGRVAGAQVMWSDGQVGSATSVLLRGLTSVTRGNEPLIYIDGVRMANGSGRRGGLLGSNPLDLINPSLIERIEVLQGPQAIRYGSGAANGVLLIFTKKGGPRRR